MDDLLLPPPSYLLVGLLEYFSCKIEGGVRCKVLPTLGSKRVAPRETSKRGAVVSIGVRFLLGNRKRQRELFTITSCKLITKRIGEIM